MYNGPKKFGTPKLNSSQVYFVWIYLDTFVLLNTHVCLVFSKNFIPSLLAPTSSQYVPVRLLAQSTCLLHVSHVRRYATSQVSVLINHPQCTKSVRHASLFSKTCHMSDTNTSSHPCPHVNKSNRPPLRGPQGSFSL